MRAKHFRQTIPVEVAWLGQAATDEAEDETMGRYLAKYRFHYIDEERRVIEPLGFSRRDVCLRILTDAITAGVAAFVWLAAQLRRK